MLGLVGMALLRPTTIEKPKLNLDLKLRGTASKPSTQKIKQYEWQLKWIERVECVARKSCISSSLIPLRGTSIPGTRCSRVSRTYVTHICENQLFQRTKKEKKPLRKLGREVSEANLN